MRCSPAPCHLREDAGGTAIQHVQVNPKPVRELNPAVSQALENVVAKAMEKDPKQRYASAIFMAQALHAALLADKEPTMDTPVFPAAQKEKPRRKPNARHKLMSRILILALSLVLLIGIGLGSVLIYRDIVNATRAPSGRGNGGNRHASGRAGRLTHGLSGYPAMTRWAW